ncbi:hypothetical protein WICPIJ_006047 [Wickerhamomyces pijperi]|uniref:Conserved oligomeric Golgi complex subunit 5 n=1 Tax=Wickerhamomyces pijperi TaxID=599730 RepID=A0A9P8Q2Y4_WICPI|nr:hypothetical protein WICPIJ_006047 [Wickerhamomyces pijperi]
MTTTFDDISEYETLFDPNFQCTTFANDLLLATNSLASELDISTSIKRVKFDIDNINTQLDKISGEEHTKLVHEIEQDTQAKKMFADLSTPLAQINTSFQRLDTDLIKPFNESVKCQDALKRIHQTATLIRAVDQFLVIVGKIEDITNIKNYDTVIIQNVKLLITLARLFHNLTHFLQTNGNLKSIKIIRDYQSIQTHKQQQLISLIQQPLRQLNEKSQQLRFNTDISATYLHSLYLLSPKLLTETITIILTIQITTSVNLLVRSLSSKNLFKQTMQEVSEKASFINQIVKLLDTNINCANGEVNILAEVSRTLGVKSYSVKFWKDVSVRFEPKFMEFIKAGSITVNAFRKDLPGLKQAVKEAVKSSQTDANDDSDLVSGMLQCLDKLNN